MITNYTCSNHLNIAKFWRRSVELWRRMTKLVWLSCLMHKFSRSFLNTKLNQRLKINEQTLDFSVIRSLAIKLCIWNKIQSWVWCCDSMLLAEREKTVVIDGEIWFCHCMQIVTFIKHPKCIKYAKLWHCTYWCWIRESSHFYLPFKYCRAQCHSILFFHVWNSLTTGNRLISIAIFSFVYEVCWWTSKWMEKHDKKQHFQLHKSIWFIDIFSKLFFCNLFDWWR